MFFLFLSCQDNSSQEDSSAFKKKNKSGSEINEGSWANEYHKTNQVVSSVRISALSNNGMEESNLSSVSKAIIKDDLLVEKAYIFGTDVDPFIVEIDFLNIKVIKKSAPLALRLFQHQCAVRISGNGNNS